MTFYICYDRHVRRNWGTLKLCLFFKIKNNLTPPYLRSLIPRDNQTQYRLRSASNATLPIPYSRLSSTRNAFVHSTVKLWNTLHLDVRSAPSLSMFKRRVKLVLFKQHNNKFLPSLYCRMPLGKASVFLSRLRMGLSALNFHRFTYNFIPHKSCPNCNYESENIVHFLFQCPTYAAPRAVLLESLSSLIPNEILSELAVLEQYLIFGSSELPVKTNLEIFSLVSRYLDATGRFDHN